MSVAVGLGFALSSTAIVTQVLIEARRLATPTGRTAFAVLLFQDLMVVPIVIVVGLLGGEEAARVRRRRARRSCWRPSRSR